MGYSPRRVQPAADALSYAMAGMLNAEVQQRAETQLVSRIRRLQWMTAWDDHPRNHHLDAPV